MVNSFCHFRVGGFVLLLARLLCIGKQSVKAEICAAGDYRYLALEGGDVRGIAYAGAFRALADAGILAGIRGFAGTSAGSIGAAMLAVGYGPEELDQVLSAIDFNSLVDASGNKIPDLSRFMSNFAWSKGEVLEQVINSLLHRKTGYANLTFNQLYETTGRELRLTAVCVNNGNLTYFDKERFGDLSVARAVRASAAIPLFFRPVWIEGKAYVGGGMLRTFPFDAYSAGLPPSEAMLGISLRRGGRASGVPHRDHLKSLPDYDPDNDKVDLVSLNISAINPVDFSLCKNHKDCLVSEGYHAVADRLVRCKHVEESKLNRPDRVALGVCPEEELGKDSANFLRKIPEALVVPMIFVFMVVMALAAAVCERSLGVENN